MAKHDDEIDQLLTTLKLKRIGAIVGRELAAAEKAHPSYRDFLARLLREEVAATREARTASRIHRAKLPEAWTLETFPFDKQPSVPAATIRQLGELDFIAQKRNVVFIGPTGVGKTGLATAITLNALRSGYRCRFVKAQDLFDELLASVADRSSRRVLDHLARMDLLLIDSCGVPRYVERLRRPRLSCGARVDAGFT